MFSMLLKGLLIGFAIAAPVGPIGVLCIQRSLHDGFKIGLLTGLGAAFADGVYGLIAGLGITAVSGFLIKEQAYIRIGGGLFLLYLGIHLLRKHHRPVAATLPREQSAWHVFIGTFLLTLTNPMTILSFVAIFAGLGLGDVNTDYFQAIFLVLGVVLGSAAWWFLLSGAVACILHRKINPGMLVWINRLSGIMIVLFGLYAMLG